MDWVEPQSHEPQSHEPEANYAETLYSEPMWPERPVSEFLFEPVTEPVSEFVTEPDSESVSESVSEPASSEPRFSESIWPEPMSSVPSLATSNYAESNNAEANGGEAGFSELTFPKANFSEPTVAPLPVSEPTFQASTVWPDFAAHVAAPPSDAVDRDAELRGVGQIGESYGAPHDGSSEDVLGRLRESSEADAVQGDSPNDLSVSADGAPRGQIAEKVYGLHSHAESPSLAERRSESEGKRSVNHT